MVQLYVSRQGNGQLYPTKALKGFQRVTLDPGEVRDVQLILTREALQQRDGLGQSHNFERGTLGITLGPNSSEGLTWTTDLP